MKTDINMLEKKTQEIRTLVLEMCAKAGTGHVTSSFSCAEILVALYYGGILRFDPKCPEWEDRDKFILSKGQASPILYAVLADLGFYSKDELGEFCSEKGIFGVHLQHDVPGVEITSGSLGQGIGIATGIALGHKMNRELPLTVALLGDGECHEGSVWEAAMFASQNKLNNLIAIVDRNYLCATHFTENSLSLEPLVGKWESFGWETYTVDGHDIEALLKVMKNIRSRTTTGPIAIIAETVKGKGVDFMCDHPLWHGIAPTGEQIEQAFEELKKGDV
jgi:transketolase